jgi:hypothetical protein
MAHRPDSTFPGLSSFGTTGGIAVSPLFFLQAVAAIRLRILESFSRRFANRPSGGE